MEERVGTCWRPTLDLYDHQFCDGSYTRRMGQQERCCLTEIGVRYWHLVPRLFPISELDGLSGLGRTPDPGGWRQYLGREAAAKRPRCRWTISVKEE